MYLIIMQMFCILRHTSKHVNSLHFCVFETVGIIAIIN